MINRHGSPSTKLNFNDVRRSHKYHLDGVIDAMDGGIFNDVLLVADDDATHVECCDVDRSGNADVDDIAEIVARRLSA